MSIPPDEFKIFIIFQQIEHLLGLGQAALRDQQAGKITIRFLFRFQKALLRFLCEPADVRAHLLVFIHSLFPEKDCRCRLIFGAPIGHKIA